MKPNQIARTIREDGAVISTIKVLFLDWHGKYETAVSFDNQERWYIAEGYETEKQAIEGHEKYKNMSSEELEHVEWIG